MIAIESNGTTIAIARNEDVIECTYEGMADALRDEGYLPISEGATSRPATDAERDAYYQWAGRAC
jgi:hypothetical protein